MKERFKELIPPNANNKTATKPFDQTIGFVQISFANGTINILPERSKWILARYISDPNTTYDSLKQHAGVTNRERVRQLVKAGLRNLWNASSADIQRRYPREIILYERKEMSAEARERLRLSGSGRTHSAETRVKLSQLRRGKPSPMLGKKHSEETKARMSQSQRNIGQETRERRRLARLGKPSPMLGKQHTQESKARISEASKGRLNPMLGKKHSEESKEKMRLARVGKPPPMLGRQHKPETKEKISKTMKGRKISPETRAKMSAAHRKRKEQEVHEDQRLE